MTANDSRTTQPQQELWHELMQFYIAEAWLLDERRFREWLDLFTDDVLYFMPRRLNVHRHELHRELSEEGDLAIFEDDKTLPDVCGWTAWRRGWRGRRTRHRAPGT